MITRSETGTEWSVHGSDADCGLMFDVNGKQMQTIQILSKNDYSFEEANRIKLECVELWDVHSEEKGYYYDAHSYVEPRKTIRVVGTPRALTEDISNLPIEEWRKEMEKLENYYPPKPPSRIHLFLTDPKYIAVALGIIFIALPWFVAMKGILF